MSELSELERKKLEYPILFYYMPGCPHCVHAEEALDPEIKSGIIGPFDHTQNPPAGVQGFPYFFNNRNKKTVTGWPGSKKALYDQLDYKEKVEENFKVVVPPRKKQVTQHQKQCYYDCTQDKVNKSFAKQGVPQLKSMQQTCNRKCNIESYTNPPNCMYKDGRMICPIKKERFSENFEMESVPNYPVVNYIETIPPDIHYYHHTGGGYSKLSNCWVKRPDFTA